MSPSRFLCAPHYSAGTSAFTIMFMLGKLEVVVMARFIHLFVVVSGFALLAVVPLSFFNLPAWLLQQNSITFTGIAGAFALGFVIAGGDVAIRRLRATFRTWIQRQSAAHPFPKPVSGSVIAESPTWQRQAV